MVLQPAPQSSEEPVHKAMQAYTDTLHATQREFNLTTTMLQDIPTFDGQDSSKSEDWFMNIYTTTAILTESCTHLAKAKFCGLNCDPIPETTQTGKCWDEIIGLLRLKLCNANIHIYTSRFMEIQQTDNETHAVYIHCFKQHQSNVFLIITLWQSAFLLKDLGMDQLSHPKYMKRTPKLWLKSSGLMRSSAENTSWQVH